MKVRDAFDVNPTLNSNKYKDFINYIDTSSVNDGRLDNVTYLESDFPSRAQRVVKKNDILYSSVRPNLRHYYLYNDDFDHVVASTGFVLLRKKPNVEIDILFVYYFLRTSEIVKHLSNIAELSQSTFPSFSAKDIGKIDLPDIPYESQVKIGAQLNRYDRLIKQNSLRIQNLEEQASELYKEWFVRFRFPGWEESHLENGIPKGWEIKRLSDVANIVMGQSPSSDNYNLEKQGLPFHQGVSSYGKFYLIDDVYSTGGNRIGQPFSIIFSVRAPVGRLNITLNKVILGRGVAAINAKNGNNTFLFWALKAKFSHEDMIGNGSIFSSVTKPELSKQRLLIPPKSLEDSFNHISSTIEKGIRVLTFANANLTEQKDLLLIRLLHNEIGL